MKISDFMNELALLKGQYGDLEVDTRTIAGDRDSHSGPTIANRKILKGREHKSRFASPYESEDRNGLLVCKV